MTSNGKGRVLVGVLISGCAAAALVGCSSNSSSSPTSSAPPTYANNTDREPTVVQASPDATPVFKSESGKWVSTGLDCLTSAKASLAPQIYADVCTNAKFHS